MGYMLGPAVGGLMVATGGASAAFLLDAASFVLSAMLVWTVRGDFSGRTSEGAEEHHGIRAGFRFILRDRVLRRMISPGRSSPSASAASWWPNRPWPLPS